MVGFYLGRCPKPRALFQKKRRKNIAGVMLLFHRVIAETSRFARTSVRLVNYKLVNDIYPIARVKLSYGVGHFVLIVGSENGEYLCMDPLKEKQEPVPLSEFGDKIYFIRYFEK